MLKSLYSGVSGLQAHQVAMDVESNNIANVNTVGFKYSRANFSDLLAQTNQISTAPQGALGGKNAVQIGLGTTINSMTRIHSQGSIQNSDKNTDVAIQGDGFFIVSPDGGKTYNYTRAGDFKFDANGNFVDNNGMIVQGWLRDEETGNVDSTAPIENIVIPPGLTTPAKASTQINLKANLNSGDTVRSFSAIRALDPFNRAADLNRDGRLDQSDSLSTPQSAYDNLPWNNGDSNLTTNTDRINENSPSHIFQDSNGRIMERGENVGVLVNSSGQGFLLQSGDVPDQGQGIWVGFRSANVTASSNVSNSNLSIAAGDITINNVAVPAINTTPSGTNAQKRDQNTNAIVSKINSVRQQTGVTAVALDVDGDGLKDKVQLINDNTSTVKNIRVGISGNGGDSGLTNGASDTPMKQFRFTDGSVNAVGWESTPVVNSNASITDDPGTHYPFPASSVTVNGVSLSNPSTINNQSDYVNAINNAFPNNEISASAHTGSSTAVDITSSETDVIVHFSDSSAHSTTGDGLLDLSSIPDTYYFTTTEDLREGMQELLRNDRTLNLTDHSKPGTGYHTALNQNATIEVDSTGKFVVRNPGGGLERDISIAIDGISDASTTENTRFTQTMQALAGSLPAGSSGVRQSQAMNVPTHSSSIDVYDSLGTKHTVRIDFRKQSFDPTTGSTWRVMITVPEPGVINVAGGTTGMPTNMIEGQVSFNADGSLSTFTPPSITFTANNGSAPNQTINLAVGTANAFDGLTSFDSRSTTSGISQDGYTGGDLVGIRIDQSGTLVGSFSNGRSFGLAQIAMAKFANNEGLAVNGGNLYVQSANSGDPIIGTAATGGRGFIQSSALEASNVDLSRSLTQLIIIQRGYQANGKTITTSDQLLQTLIGLKQ